MLYDFRRPRLASASILLLVFLLLGFLLRVTVHLQVPSLVHADEVFQTQEPAHRLAYGYGVTSWEWRQGVRSWVFPAFLAGLMRATEWMGSGSRGYLSAITIALSLLSLTTVWFGFSWAKRTSGTNAAIIAAGACATWYDLIYFAPRTLDEVVAAHLLLPGLYLGVWGERISERKRMFLAGIFCGLAVSLRIQLAPAVAFAALYFCRSNWRTRAPAAAAGLCLPLIAFGLVDGFTWSYPFQSFIRYVWVNTVERRSLLYGTEPWYWYLVRLAHHFGPMMLLALVGVRRSAFLGWVALIILASHSILAHKELRFVYPLMPIVVTLASLGIMEIAAALGAFRKAPLSSTAVVVAGLAFCGMVSLFLASLAGSHGYFSEDSGGLIAMDALSKDANVCGVALYQVGWFATGGYAHLHHDVPIVLIPDRFTLAEQVENFNFVLTDEALDDRPSGFKLQQCRQGVCIYRRPGSCTPPQHNEINTVLRATGR